MNQQKIWNSLAEPWSKYRTQPTEEVKKFLKNKSGKILDLGCGSGRNFIKKENLEFYGTDFSKKMLSLAKKYNYKELKLSSAEKIPYPDNFFNSAIFVAVLHCIPEKNKREKSLKELFRVLKSKSQLLITVWSSNHKRIKNSGENLIPWTHNKIKHPRFYYIYTKEELASLLKKVGFTILKIKENENIVAVVEK